MANITDFRMAAANDRRLRILVKDPAGAPVEVVDARWLLAESSVGRVLVQKKVGAGVTIPDQTDARGVFYVDLVPADTVDLDGRFYHEARVLTPGGQAVTVLRGEAQIDGTPLS